MRSVHDADATFSSEMVSLRACGWTCWVATSTSSCAIVRRGCCAWPTCSPAIAATPRTWCRRRCCGVARRWRRIRGEPAPYARRAVVNLAKNHWRDRFRRPRESTETVEPCYAPPEADVLLQQVLLPAVMDLPVRQRAVLVLRYFQDLSVEQTAAALDCSIGTVKSQTHHALTKLREALDDPTELKENDHAH